MTAASRFWNVWRILGWGAAAMLLLLPLVAMRFTQEVNWTASDFVFAGVLIASVGGGFELAVRLSGNRAYRMAAGIGLAGIFLMVWINGAVGIVANENQPANLMIFAVVLVGMTGALAARLRPHGMAQTLAAMAVAQTVIAAIVPAAGLDLKALPLCLFFAGLWLISAMLFRKAAIEQAESRS
jgi:hypothetical protein